MNRPHPTPSAPFPSLRRVAALAALLCAAGLAACDDGGPAGAALDGSSAPDAMLDTMADATPDGTPDGTPDAMSDADAMPDAIPGADATPDAMPDAAPPAPLIPYDPACENLVDGHCMLPWPSDRWLEPDPDTATGYRLAYDPAAAPANRFGNRIDPAPYARLDGFSPSSQLMTVFPRPADLDGIGGPDAIDASLADDFPTVVLDLETGERVPHWIEHDARADDPALTALYIRPATRLRPDRAYAVAIRGLRDADGDLLPAPPGFAALRDGEQTHAPRLEARRAGFEDLFAALADAGVERADLQLAWRFHTESLASARDVMLAMRADALARLGDEGIGCTVTEVDEDADPDTLRIVRGTITTPWYLDRPTQPARIVVADGMPQWVEDREVPFTALVPRAAQEAPSRLIFFGHGLFGNAADTLQNGALRRAANTISSTFVGTDWAGMSTSDLGFLATALADVSRFWHLGEMLRQGIINHIAMARTVLGVCLDDPAFRVDDRPVFDPERRGFIGVSQGSILGGALLALHPDVERGVLLVGGSGFSFMIERSVHYQRFQTLLDPNYPRRIDTALLMAVSQHDWDRAESAGWLGDLRDGVPGVGPREVLYFVAENDAQVPNLSAHRAARLAGLPVVEGSSHLPWGTATVAPPHVGSAYLAFDLGDRLPLAGNLAPEADDGGHSELPVHPAALETMRGFLDDGVVDPPCVGPCRFLD